MAPTITAGHHAIVYVTGAATAYTTATGAMTLAGDYKSATITDAAKRIIYPIGAATVEESTDAGGSWHDYVASAYILNRLTGTVTFPAARTSTYLYRIKVDGSWIALGQLLYAKEYALSMKKKLVDVTPFGVNAQVIVGGLGDANGTLGNFYGSAEVASLTLPAYFNVKLIAGTVFAIKFYVNANLSYLAWALIDTEEMKPALDGVIEQTVSWSGTPDSDGHVISRL